MFDHALVGSQFVPLWERLVAFFCHYPLVWILLFGHMPTPSLTGKDCHDVARLWGWKGVRQDNQDMWAKAVMRWTCASCGESKGVRFDNMKKFGPGKHKCSKQSPPQGKEDNAKAKDGRPSVRTVHCNQLAAEYGCDWLGVLVDKVVHVDDSLVSSICVMRWQCWGCTTNFDRTYNKMKSRGFVCSTWNTSHSKEDKKRAGQAGGVVASKEDKKPAGQAGGVVASNEDKKRVGQAGGVVASKEDKKRAGQAGGVVASKEDKKRTGQAGGVVACKEDKKRAGQAGGVVASREDKQRAGQAGSKVNKQSAGQAGSKENRQRAGQAVCKQNKRRAGQAGSKEDKQRAGQAGSKVNKQRAGQAGSKENKQHVGQAGCKLNKRRAGQAGSKEDKRRAGQAGSK